MSQFRNPLRMAGAIVAVLGCISVFALGSPAWAAESTTESPPAEAIPDCKSGAVGKPMKERTQRQVLKAIEAMDEERLDDALSILDRISERALGPFGVGLASQMRAGIAASRDDLAGAAGHLTKAVEAGGFCGERLRGARLQLSQILMALERWDDAIAQLEQVIASSPTPNGEAYYRIGLALYRANRVEESLAAVQKSVDIAGTDARESWWLLLVQIHWDRQEYDQCLPILQRLVIENPKRDYWLRLAFALYELKRPDEAMIAMQLADLGGYLEGKTDQLRLVQMEISEGVPYRAAARLDKAITTGVIPLDQQTLEVLSNTWLAARDRKQAIAPLVKAAEMSPDGRNWLRAAQISAQLDDWTEVTASLNRAINKGSLDDEGMAYFLLGMAHYNLKETDQARAAFTRALGHEKSRNYATTWLAMLAESERASGANGAPAGENPTASSVE